MFRLGCPRDWKSLPKQSISRSSAMRRPARPSRSTTCVCSERERPAPLPFSYDQAALKFLVLPEPTRTAANEWFTYSQKRERSRETPVLSVLFGTFCSSPRSSGVHLHGRVSGHSSQVHVDEQKRARIMHVNVQKAKERRICGALYLLTVKIQTRCCSDWIRPRI